MLRHCLYYQMVTDQLFGNRIPAKFVNNKSYIQDISGGKINIFEGASIDNCERKIQHFNFQPMHTTFKNVELLKHFKISKTTPTCFGLKENHHQGATIST